MRCAVLCKQVQKVVGAAAPPEFVDGIAVLCHDHDPRIKARAQQRAAATRSGRGLIDQLCIHSVPHIENIL
jgi:hypothetical protein